MKQKPWDDTFKKLIRIQPEAFVRWLSPNAHFLQELPHTLEQEDLHVDGLLQVEIVGQSMLLHIELQTYPDAQMAERILRYNVLAHMKYDLPVLSYVIYLLESKTLPPSLLIWRFPDEQEQLRFSFDSIHLAQFSVEDLLIMDLSGLLPLLPLTSNGANSEQIERMFHTIENAQDLAASDKKELQLIGYTLASLIYRKKSPEEQAWLIRRFNDMHEILRDTPIYQAILQEGRQLGVQEGRQLGVQEGRQIGVQEGRQNELRKMIVAFAEARSARLRPLAEQQVQLIQSTSMLETLVLKVGLAQNAQEVEEVLLHWPTWKK